jgi:phospholipid-translocating ATPase
MTDIIKAISCLPKRFGNFTAIVREPTSPVMPWATVKWTSLKVGDIIELRRDDQVPADIVLLHADGQQGIAYTETMALDGETNLKSKEPSNILVKCCNTLIGIAQCQAHFVIEDPNLDLYDFSGKVTVDGTTLPLSLNNVIFRGSTLRNTTSAIGMVINTGEECKIRMNASKNPKAKAPALQTETNKAVISLAALVILLAIGCTAGYAIWQRTFEHTAWYLENAQIWMVDIFIAFAIEFNNLIPLALYVSLEIVKFCQYVLLKDIEMYDPVTDIPMVANTQTIFENLGQISYIFSDKTGTLTENDMRFRKMSVAGTTWLYKEDRSVEVPSHILGTNEALEKRKSSVTSSPVADGLLHIPKRPQSVVSQLSSSLLISSHELYTDELLQYLQSSGDTHFAQKIKLFLLSMAICHTCFPEVDENGKIRYQAASPDEVALVEAARDLGYVVSEKTTKSITIATSFAESEVSVPETYEILDVIEFSSGRKRMSVIVRYPSGKIYLFCKGADSVIQPRLRLASLAAQEASKVAHQDRQRMSLEVEQVLMRRSGEEESRKSLQRPSFQRPSFQRASRSFDRLGRPSFQRASRSFDRRGVGKKSSEFPRTSMSVAGLGSPSFKPSSPLQRIIDVADNIDDAGIFERCFQDINHFASDGFRTLLYGYRVLDEDEYRKWKEIYHKAETSLLKRQDMIESAAEMIERDLYLAGATAIEDKLQKGVPETIEKLQKANIKIWMLTGDKRETAINVAHAAKLCKTYSEVVILSQEQCESQISSMLLDITEGRIAHSVVVIDGQMLGEIESEETLAAKFTDLLTKVDSVIVCRASPSQKANMVKKIRHCIPSSMTLAIGDGGNDIAMIQEAHVGVGISGKEGLQAARVADYSIAQFRFLQRLLLVHGHWNYSRTADYVLYTFWKEMMFYCVQVMYQRWNGYTGPSFFETTGLTVWNTLFSSLCVMIPAIFEQDISATTLLAVPELYSYGQKMKGFNMKLYTWWMIIAAIQAQIIWWMIYGLYGVVNITDDQGLFALGNLAFSICVVYINLKLL